MENNKVDKKWYELTEEKQKLELEKCKIDPYYFYSTYINVVNPSLKLTREEFIKEYSNRDIVNNNKKGLYPVVIE
jgi:hypothetical protein